MVTVFNLHTLRRVASLPADKDTDAMAYDAATGLLVVGSGDAKAASISIRLIRSAAARLLRIG